MNITQLGAETYVYDTLDIPAGTTIVGSGQDKTIVQVNSLHFSGGSGVTKASNLTLIVNNLELDATASVVLDGVTIRSTKPLAPQGKSLDIKNSTIDLQPNVDGMTTALDLSTDGKTTVSGSHISIMLEKPTPHMTSMIGSYQKGPVTLANSTVSVKTNGGDKAIVLDGLQKSSDVKVDWSSPSGGQGQDMVLFGGGPQSAHDHKMVAKKIRCRIHSCRALYSCYNPRGTSIEASDIDWGVNYTPNEHKDEPVHPQVATKNLQLNADVLGTGQVIYNDAGYYCVVYPNGYQYCYDNYPYNSYDYDYGYGYGYPYYSYGSGYRSPYYRRFTGRNFNHDFNYDFNRRGNRSTILVGTGARFGGGGGGDGGRR